MSVQGFRFDALIWTYRMVGSGHSPVMGKAEILGTRSSKTSADLIEEFATELEAFASHLVTENQQLQHENKQLNALLKEYEQTLETVMGKFRGVAVRHTRCMSHGRRFAKAIARFTAARTIPSLILYISPTSASNGPLFRPAA